MDDCSQLAARVDEGLTARAQRGNAEGTVNRTVVTDQHQNQRARFSDGRGCPPRREGRPNLSIPEVCSIKISCVLLGLPTTPATAGFRDAGSHSASDELGALAVDPEGMHHLMPHLPLFETRDR